ncbi:hypothetical protein [Abyssibacter profundi]|nr:hypothetical protein [Abyssibacter profundi]
MLMLAVTGMLLAAVAGVILLAWTDESPTRSWLRVGHVVLGVLTLTLVLVGAHDAGVSAQGALIGLVGFTTATGGTLFRQRMKQVTRRRRALTAHVALGALSLFALLALAGGLA